MSSIYKLLDGASWRATLAVGTYYGSPADLADGFIHFSSADQLQETARRHFKGVADLVLLEVDPSALGAPLTWEPSRGGDLFPHLYAPMPLAAVRQARTLELDSEGVPVIGALAP